MLKEYVSKVFLAAFILVSSSTNILAMMGDPDGSEEAPKISKAAKKRANQKAKKAAQQQVTAAIHETKSEQSQAPAACEPKKEAKKPSPPAAAKKNTKKNAEDAKFDAMLAEFQKSNPVAAVASAAVPQAQKKKNGKITVVAPIVRRTQEQINEFCIEEARSIFEQMNKNWVYVSEDEDAKMIIGSKSWKAKWTEQRAKLAGVISVRKVPTLIFDDSAVRICEAFDDLIANPATVECTIAITTAKHLLIRKYLGDAAYKQCAVKYLKGMPSDWKHSDFFNEFPRQFFAEVKGQAIIPGAFGFITNVEEYKIFKTRGNAAGDNVFCVEEDNYLCFYPGDTGNTLAQLEEHYLEEFVKTSDLDCDEKQTRMHTQLAKHYSENPENFRESRRGDQLKCNMYWYLSAEKINEYARSRNINYYPE